MARAASVKSLAMRRNDVDDELNAWSNQIIASAIGVHSALGPGLLESVYEGCLELELINRGLGVDRQYLLPVIYKGCHFQSGFRVDILVNRLIVVEVKAITTVAPVHAAQLLSYLRLGNLPLGLLINFHVEHLKDGIRRLVNHRRDSL